MIAPPDVAAYLQAIASPATTELRLYEQIASTLKDLRFDDAASRKSTAAALIGIQAQIGPLAAALDSVRTPARLMAAHAARGSAIKHMAAVAGHVANALTGDAATRSRQIEIARHEAEGAQGATRVSAGGITAAFDVSTETVSTVPVVGTIIAAILTAVAAIIVLLGQIQAQARKDDAAEKADPPGPARTEEGDD